MSQEPTVVERADLRDREGVFADRDEAGRVLAEMLSTWRGTDRIVLAIPSGGVPVAVVLARQLRLPLGVAVVSKITLPWNSEVGFGAVAFDGTTELDEDLIARVGLTEEQVGAGLDLTRVKVERRVRRFGSHAAPESWGRRVVLVDDGLASGRTMRVAVSAVRRAGAEEVVVAVPTAHERALRAVAAVADRIYCANVRRGWSFAVADAYRRWSDVDEGAAVRWLATEATPAQLV